MCLRIQNGYDYGSDYTTPKAVCNVNQNHTYSEFCITQECDFVLLMNNVCIGFIDL